MKVLAYGDYKNVVVQMTERELINLAGFDGNRQFDQAIGCSTFNNSHTTVSGSLLNVENIPVGEIYQEAKDTLSAYEELKTKFESIRNQLTTLLKRMVSLNPAPKED